jgi:hypothetical protein
MTRGVARYLVGSLVVLMLFGCGRWFAEREPWRREAEIACLKSGEVKEGPTVRIIRPIAGPGVCGADYPLRVATLGESSTATGFADELRPPGLIPQGAPSNGGPPYPPNNRFATAPYQNPATVGAPVAITPTGVGRPDNDEPGTYVGQPSFGSSPPAQVPQSTYSSPSAYPRQSYPPQGYPPPGSRLQPVPPLGPGRISIPSGPATVQPPATLACPMVSALDHWMTDAVQPAAQRWFGQPVAEIRQISAYSCRSMKGERGAPISEHAFGNALDIAAFTLADGRKVTVREGWHGVPEEQGFLHDVQAAACRQFSTVLAPGSNVFHYDHIHVDLARHASGRAICNPDAVSGEVAAAQAAQRQPYARRRDPAVTGSIGGSRAQVSRYRGQASGSADRNLLPAEPGAD